MSRTDAPDATGDYLRSLSAVPLLDAAGEVRLARMIEAGLYAGRLLADGGRTGLDPADLTELVRQGAAAHDLMIRSNLRLVVSVAKRYVWSGLPLLDLAQEGNLGLMHAVDMFDWARGVKFSTYATIWIRQAVVRGVEMSARTIRLSPGVLADLSVVRVARRDLAENGTEPTEAQVAARSGLTLDRVREVVLAGRDVAALDAPVGDDPAGAVLSDVVMDDAWAARLDAAETRADAPARRAAIVAAVLDLSPRESEVLMLRYGLTGGQPMTLKATASALGVTPGRVAQAEALGVRRLRSKADGSGLRGWWDVSV